MLYVVFSFPYFVLFCFLYIFEFLYFLDSGRKRLPFLIHYTYENEQITRVHLVAAYCCCCRAPLLSRCSYSFVVFIRTLSTFTNKTYENMRFTIFQYSFKKMCWAESNKNQIRTKKRKNHEWQQIQHKHIHTHTQLIDLFVSISLYFGIQNYILLTNLFSPSVCACESLFLFRIEHVYVMIVFRIQDVVLIL